MPVAPGSVRIALTAATTSSCLAAGSVWRMSSTSWQRRRSFILIYDTCDWCKGALVCPWSVYSRWKIFGQKKLGLAPWSFIRFVTRLFAVAYMDWKNRSASVVGARLVGKVREIGLGLGAMPLVVFFLQDSKPNQSLMCSLEPGSRKTAGLILSHVWDPTSDSSAETTALYVGIVEGLWVFQ